MSTPEITLTDLGGSGPPLVVGPSLGTSASTLWAPCAGHLVRRFRVLAWDLPGHGASAPATGFSTSDLARGVLTAVTGALGRTTTVTMAGDSLGAAISLEAALLAPDRLAALVLACTGAKIGESGAWLARAESARSGGLDPGGEITAATPSRWFGSAFTAQAPELVRRLVRELSDVDPRSYAACCEALAGYDVRSRLGDLSVAVLAVAGSSDVVTPTALLAELADGAPRGRLVELPGVGHLAPVEAPGSLADLIDDHVAASGGEHPSQRVPG